MAKDVIYILKTDADGTMRSIDKPFGYAVRSEEEAKRFVKDGGMGYTHSYDKIVICDTIEEVKDGVAEENSKMINYMKSHYGTM